MRGHVLPVLLLLATAGCRVSPPPQARSLLGEPLRPPPVDPEVRGRLEANLEAARHELTRDPDGEDAIVWYGRRLAYLGLYREAIAAYTRGLELHPRSFRLLRHRGHRWITVRELDRAVDDLSRAARLIDGVPDAVEPDGAPNPHGIPRSTSHTNITYHLGLAHYLRGEWEPAVEAYRRCVGYSTNDDMLVAATYWLHLSLRRLGRDAEARAVLEPIRADMEILENDEYHRLLLFYRGELSFDELLGGSANGLLRQFLTGEASVSSATLGYGIGIFELLEGDEASARSIFESILDAGAWPAFGHVAAEAELARIR